MLAVFIEYITEKDKANIYQTNIQIDIHSRK